VRHLSVPGAVAATLWVVRLFIAAWPDPSTVDRVALLERPVVAGLRWTSVDQWHVTLRFLGEVDDPAPVAEALRPLGSATTEVTLGPVTAWFPGGRVLQVPVSGLEEVAADVAELTAPFVPLDSGREAHRRFTGHLTLARVRGTPLPAGVAAALAGVRLASSWTVGDVTLVASQMQSAGARYEVLARFALAGGAVA
jgi:RNA 2',3'-cyclic 3'-phosphodiesterase